METLKKQWTGLAEKYCSSKAEIENCFNDIWIAYTESHRHYHNLTHISSMIQEIDNNPDNSLDHDVLLFATWFHDIVYNPKKHDNEEKSAMLAVKMLKQLGVPQEKIKKVETLILATANHMNINDPDPDMCFFLDCDLKVLGATREQYILYAEDIRKEYIHVLSLIYSIGRKKILKRFIESSSIYRTEYFKNKYEKQARSNIMFEIKNL